MCCLHSNIRCQQTLPVLRQLRWVFLRIIGSTQPSPHDAHQLDMFPPGSWTQIWHPQWTTSDAYFSKCNQLVEKIRQLRSLKHSNHWGYLPFQLHQGWSYPGICEFSWPSGSVTTVCGNEVCCLHVKWLGKYLLRSTSSYKIYPPENQHFNWKGTILKGHYFIVQPSICRAYVSFQGG